MHDDGKALGYATVREAGENVAMALRATRDLPGFVRHSLTRAEAAHRIRRGLAERTARFLDVLTHAVYGNRRSPYRRLLQHAGCEPGDAEALVRREGVEGALHVLADRGVYVTFDEFKGRRAAVRGSARFHFAARDFDYPGQRPHLLVFTGGSGGRPMRVRRTLGCLDNSGAAYAVALEAHRIRSPRVVLWIGAYPTWALTNLRLGHEVAAWFHPLRPLHPAARVALPFLALLSRLGGRRMPLPQYADLQQPERIVRWLSRHRRPGQHVVVNTTASSSARLAIAASAAGVALDGVTFHCRSEPLTAARRALIEGAGGSVFAEYGTTELCSQAFSCPNGTSPDDLHLFTDQFAMINHTGRGDDGDAPRLRLLQTSLSRYAAKLALNVDFGDSARLEDRECGCSMGALGLRTHLSEIRSYEKLSSEGITLARHTVLAAIEEFLPRRFGGTALDYQLVEEEAADGRMLLALYVHPGVGPVDEHAIVEALLSEIGRGDFLRAHQSQFLRRAESLVVRRSPPLSTHAAKILPFQPARHARRTQPNP